MNPTATALIAAAERRRIIQAGEDRAAQLNTPRQPHDATVRLTGGKEDE